MCFSRVFGTEKRWQCRRDYDGMDDACNKSEITCWKALDGSPWNCPVLSLSLHCFPFLCIIPSSSRDMGRPSRCNECSTAIDQLSRFSLCTKCRLNKPERRSRTNWRGFAYTQQLVIILYLFNKEISFEFWFFLGFRYPIGGSIDTPPLALSS